MKERAVEIVAFRPPAASGVNVLREYVQSRVLGIMQEEGAFVRLAFMGGTALRFLYHVPRFSEGLDFTLERGSIDFRELSAAVARGLEREGYAVRMRIDDRRVVARTAIGFEGLLAYAGLSPHAEEVLWVQLEVDTDPPAGAGLEVTLVDRFGPLRLQHHDLPSLFAGKLAAVIAREYTKGRDLYDLMWYLMREQPIDPNVQLLGNALRQTAPAAAERAVADWRATLRDAVIWSDAGRDVAPFLEQPRDIRLLDATTFEALLR